MEPVSPVGRVPVLVDDGFAVWDTLAIAEYAAEKFPDKQLWPQDAKARARARSVCAEMHAGFGALRSHCPMNIEASLPQVGALVWRDQPAVRSDVQRIVAMWTELLEAAQGAHAFRRVQHCRRLLRAGLHAPEELRPAGARATSPTTSAACARCRASRPGSRMRWPRKTSSTSTSLTERRDERRHCEGRGAGVASSAPWSRRSTTRAGWTWMPRSAWRAGWRSAATMGWWSPPRPAKPRP